MIRTIYNNIHKVLTTNNKYYINYVILLCSTIIIIIIVKNIYNRYTTANNTGNTASNDNNGKTKKDMFENISNSDKAIDTVPTLKRPFLNIYDDKGRKINIIFITHPFSRDESYTEYTNAIKQGVQFLGLSSYCEFPGIISNPHDVLHDPKHKAWTYDYFKLCKGWCHCFRNPAEYIPTAYPQILLSESDFAKYNKHVPDPKIKKEYDFLYVCLKDNEQCTEGWQSFNRNWEQAQECLDIMCNKFHLKGLLIGRINCKIPKGCHQLMELTDFLEYSKFIEQYNKCRFVFVPNKLDASPRVMTEAICFNLPVLCNYNITGGWKYVTPESGEFFNKEPNDFETALNTLLKNFNKYKPREFYMREFNEEKMGKQLLDFCVKTTGWTKPADVKYLVPGI